MDSRLSPLPDTFMTDSQHTTIKCSSQRRHHSIPNHIPWRLQMLYGSQDFTPQRQVSRDSNEEASILTRDIPDITSAATSGTQSLSSRELHREWSEYSSWDGVVEGDGDILIAKSQHPSAESTTTNMDAIIGMNATTLMIRNIPLDITQIDFLKEMDEDSFRDQYDFFYMPSFFKDGIGKGYAFVNFRSVEDASRFAQKWQRSHRFATKSCLGLDIRAATKQGLEANLQKWNVFSLKRIRNPNFRPFVARDSTSGKSWKSPEALPLTDAQGLLPDQPPRQHVQKKKQSDIPTTTRPQALSLSSHLRFDNCTEIVQADARSPIVCSNKQCAEESGSFLRGLPLPRVPGLQPPASTRGPVLLGTQPMSRAHQKHFGTSQCCSGFVSSQSIPNMNVVDAYPRQQ